MSRSSRNSSRASLSGLASRWPWWQAGLSRWQALQARERRMVLLAASVVGLALLWWLAVAPALSSLRQFQARAPELERQVQQMQVWRQQAQVLQGQASSITPAAALRGVQSHTPRLLGASSQVQVVGDRATVRFQQVTPDALAQWLQQMRESAHALPVQVEIQQAKAASAPANAATAPAAAPTVSVPASALRWSGTVVLSLPAVP